MAFFKKKRQSIPTIDYDPAHMEAVMKCNTCNQDRVVGFKDNRTGEFTEVMNIRSEADLDTFKRTYNIDNIREVYGW